MKNDLVSIIIPAYRAADTVERCVRSIVEGSYRNIEIILIEDHSGDSTYDVCLELQSKYPQVVCLHNEKNSGVSATRNKGLAAAKGKYLMFADSDDFVDPDFVYLMIDGMRDGVMPVCGYVNHDEAKNGRTDIFCRNESRTVKIAEGLDELYRGRLLQMIWNKVFLADVVRENGITFDTSLNCGEDFRFLLEYLKCAGIGEFLFLPRALYHYSRDNADSLATKFTEVAIDEPLRNMRKMYELMGKDSDEIERLTQEERDRQLTHYAYSYMHNEDLSAKEKKQKITALPLADGKKTYRDMRILYIKEKIMKLFKR